MSFDHVQLKNALLGRLSKAEPAEAWRELLAAGVLGLRAPEAQGGLGGVEDVAEVARVFTVIRETLKGLHLASRTAKRTGRPKASEKRAIAGRGRGR